MRRGQAGGAQLGRGVTCAGIALSRSSITSSLSTELVRGGLSDCVIKAEVSGRTGG